MNNLTILNDFLKINCDKKTAYKNFDFMRNDLFYKKYAKQLPYDLLKQLRNDIKWGVYFKNIKMTETQFDEFLLNVFDNDYTKLITSNTDFCDLHVETYLFWSVKYTSNFIHKYANVINDWNCLIEDYTKSKKQKIENLNIDFTYEKNRIVNAKLK